MIGRADIEGSKSNVAMNAWLPQASYPCGNFSDTSSFKFRRSKGSLGHAFTFVFVLEIRIKRAFTLLFHTRFSVLVELILGHLLGFPLSVPVLSWLFDARGRPPKEPFPVRPPAGTRRPALAAEAARAVRRQPTGSGLGPPCPALRANPFPEVTDPILPTSLAYIVSIDQRLFTLET
ncbi:hypothetical protein L2E82_51485 [Cichorium intybus]|nr:hypothetical protein L2E82_51485 [Cichorium intybus]